jgi:hypothetical protein
MRTSHPIARASLAVLLSRGLTILLAVLAVVGQAAFLDALLRDGGGLGGLGVGPMRPALLSSVAGGAVLSLASAVLGVAMAFRRSARPGSRAMGLALAVWAYLLAYSGILVLLAPDAGSVLREPFDAHFLVVEAVGLAALMRFSALFPRPLRPDDLRDPATLPAGAAEIQRLRRWLLRPAAPWIAALAAVVVTTATNSALGRSVEDAALLRLTDLLRLLALGVVVLNLRASWGACARPDRAPITWISLGFALMVGTVGLVLGGNVLTAATAWAVPGVPWRPIVLHLGVVGLLCGAGMGGFYRGTVDPAPLVRRVAVLAGMATLALFLAAGLESLLSGGVAARFAMPGGTGTFLALVVTAVAYGRTRRPLEGFLGQPWTEPRSAMRAKP